MSNYLKKILFSLLILVTPYINTASNAMDEGDYEGSSVRARKVSFITEEQKDVSSSIKQSTSSQVVSLEDAQTSWASYLVSPLKTTIQIANELSNFGINNPKLAIMVGLIHLSSAVSAYTCYCVNSNSPGCWFSVGYVKYCYECQDKCILYGSTGQCDCR